MGYNKLHEIHPEISKRLFITFIILTAFFLVFIWFWCNSCIIPTTVHEDSLRCWHGIYWDLFLEFSPLLYRTVWLEAVWKRARKGQDWKVPQAGTQTQVAWSTTCVWGLFFILLIILLNIIFYVGVAKWLSEYHCCLKLRRSPVQSQEAFLCGVYMFSPF